MNFSEELFQRHREIGRAIWLLTLYWSLQGGEVTEWSLVLGGIPIRDAEVASRFHISIYTAARWREDSARRESLVQRFPQDGGFRVFAYRAPFANEVLEHLEETEPSSAPWRRLRQT